MCFIIKLFFYFFVPDDYYISPKVALAEKEARHLRWFQQEREKRIEQRGIYKLILLEADSLLGGCTFNPVIVVDYIM